MSDFIRVEIDDRQVQEKLKKLAKKVSDLTPFFREAAGILAEAVDVNFEGEGRPERWRPLASATIKARSRKGHWPGPILNVSGSRGLVGSITRHYDAHSAIVGTNKVYGPIHQFGGEIQVGARTQNIHLRTEHFDARSGRWAEGGKEGARQRTRFARSLNATHGMKVDVGAHTVKIPARPFLALDDDDRQELLDAMRRHLSRQ